MVYDHESAESWVKSVPNDIPHHLKVVVMDEADLEWTKSLLYFLRDRGLNGYLTSKTVQVGTDQTPEAVQSILDRGSGCGRPSVPTTTISGRTFACYLSGTS